VTLNGGAHYDYDFEYNVTTLNLTSHFLMSNSSIFVFSILLIILNCMLFINILKSYWSTLLPIVPHPLSHFNDTTMRGNSVTI